MKTKSIIFIIISLIGILSLNLCLAYSSNSLSCYQEQTNQSILNDGNCNLNYSGSYLCIGGTWNQPCSNAYDGDWNTYTHTGSGVKQGQIYINYTTPINTIGASWNIKLGSPSGLQYNLNFIIPNNCFNQKIQLYLSTNQVPFDAVLSGYCYNGISWQQVFTNNTLGEYIYEESIDWITNISDNENLTFTGNQNITRYLSVPSNTILTNGYLNLSGYNNTNNNYCYQETANASNIIDGNCNLSYNGFYNFSDDWMNVTYNKPNSSLSSSLWQVNHGKVGIVNYSIPKSCWDYSSNNLYFSLYSFYNSGFGWANSTIYCFNGTSNVLISSNQCNQIIYFLGSPYNNYTYDGIWNIGSLFWNGFWYKTNTIGGEGCGGIMEEAMVWTIGNYPTNPSLSINNQVWNYSGIFNQLDNKTSNLANIINNYLSTCSYSNGVCQVPFIFHSDTNGILNYNDLIFNNNIIVSNVGYNNNTYETSTESYTLNISYDPSTYPVLLANLIYNGTSYSGSVINSNNGVYTFSANVNIPLVNQTTINSFYWSIGQTSTNGTTFLNSSTYNQTINQLSMGECSGNNGTKVLNFTAFDQNTLNQLTGWNFKGTLNYFLGDGSIYRTVSFLNNSVTEKDICSNTTTIKVTGEVQYTLSNYNSAEFNFINNEVNNSYPVKLYLGNQSLMTAFILKVQTTTQIPLPNYYIYVYRYDPSNPIPYLVQTSKTDPQGQTVGYFEINTVDYLFIIADTNGNIVYTSSKQKVIPQTTPYTIIFSVGTNTPNPLDYFNNLSQITSQLSFNQNTNLVTWIYSDSNSSFNYAYLQVQEINGSGNNQIICNITSTNPSAILTCDMTGNLSGTYNAIAYTNRGGVDYQVDLIVFNIEGMSSIDRNAGLFYGFLILLVCSFLFAWNISAGFIAVDMGLIGIQVLGLINFSWLAVGAFIGVSIIILIVLRGD